MKKREKRDGNEWREMETGGREEETVEEGVLRTGVLLKSLIAVAGSILVFSIQRLSFSSGVTWRQRLDSVLGSSDRRDSIQFWRHVAAETRLSSDVTWLQQLDLVLTSRGCRDSTQF